MNPSVVKQDYWEAIIEYYYDNVHWEEANPPSVYEWLEREYNAHSSIMKPWIEFKDPGRYIWFMLKFGEYARN